MSREEALDIARDGERWCTCDHFQLDCGHADNCYYILAMVELVRSEYGKRFIKLYIKSGHVPELRLKLEEESCHA